MNDTEITLNEKPYTFRGKTFSANPATVAQLNYALALNRSEERYVEVPQKETKEKAK